MYIHLPTFLVTGLLAASTVLSSPFYEYHTNQIEKRAINGREQRLVYFRQNDSSISSTMSTSWDVFSLAAHPVSGTSPGRRTMPLLGRQVCPPGQCSDGPLTNVTVKSGDTLEAIAARFDSGICNIAKLNNISNPNFILAGQNLIVPTKLCDPDNTSCVAPPGTRPCVPRSEKPSPTVTIAAGDTFFILGQRFNVTAEAFAAANPCVDAGSLQIGQKINVPICPDCPEAETCD